MNRISNGIIRVHLDSDRYRGGDLVIRAYGLAEGESNIAVPDRKLGKAAFNLARLLRIELIRGMVDEYDMPSGLSLRGSATRSNIDAGQRSGLLAWQSY